MTLVGGDNNAVKRIDWQRRKGGGHAKCGFRGFSNALTYYERHVNVVGGVAESEIIKLTYVAQEIGCYFRLVVSNRFPLNVHARKLPHLFL